jgi:hypothetical protein
MASVSVTSTNLTVTLTRFERVFGLLPNLSIPLTNVRGVAHNDAILSDIGMRAPGLAWPRKALIGTFRKWKFKDFVVWRSEPHFVVIDVTGEKWNRIVIGVTDPAAVVAAIRSVTVRNLRQ